MPKVAWFSFGGVLISVGLKVLFDNSIAGAFVLFCVGVIIAVLAYCGVLGEEVEETALSLNLPIEPKLSPQPAECHEVLSLSFDANDPQCKQQEGVPAIPHHLFRVRVNNNTQKTTHNVRVQLEDVPRSLSKLQGVELQVRHHQGTSKNDVTGGGKEYWDFLEYNSYDIAICQPVLHICHVVTSVPRHIPAADCRFMLRAHSEEGASNPMMLSFSLTGNSCQVDEESLETRQITAIGSEPTT
jgi:hypothetical protein